MAVSDAELYRELPALISFPRSGSQWLTAVMELYFDRPCYRQDKATFMDRERDDYLWFHEHDITLSLEHKDVIYLYRTPVDVLFSWLTYQFNATRRKSWYGKFVQRNDQPCSETKVIEASVLLRDHLKRWLKPQYTLIRYEALKQQPAQEFSKICKHLKQDFEVERALQCFAEVKHEKLMAVSVKKVALDQQLLSEEYARQRQEFQATYTELIAQTVMVDEIKPFFD